MFTHAWNTTSAFIRSNIITKYLDVEICLPFIPFLDMDQVIGIT